VFHKKKNVKSIKVKGAFLLTIDPKETRVERT